MHEGVLDSEVVPSSYKLIRKDRTTRGGGVAIAIKKNVKFSRLEDISNHESVWCRINFYGKSIFLGAVYRPPNSSPEYLEIMHDYIAQHTNSRSKIILCGDFNLPGINWPDLCHDHREVASAESLLLTAFSFSLSQLVSSATRIVGSCSSVLDLMFVSSSLEDCAISVEDGISDHKITSLSCPLTLVQKTKKSRATYFRDYARADDAAIFAHLESSFTDFDKINNVDELWTCFKDIVCECEDRYVPLKRKRVDREYPWVTREIIHLKRKIKRRRKAGSSDQLQGLIATLNNKIRSAKSRFHSDTLPSFMHSEPKKFWRYLSKQHSDISQLTSRNQIITQPDQIADELNAFFHSVFAHGSSGGSLPSYPLINPMPELHINEEGVQCLLRNLDTKKSPGPDNISNTFLNKYAVWVSRYLHKIYTASIVTQTIPDDWRMAKIIPIHKSGSKLESSNYRPVSLTSTCCKLLEHIIFKAIITHLETNNLLYYRQHGFRSGLSTVTQLAEITNDIANALNERGQIDAVFLDFAKAFDVVRHPDLITKMHAIGIEDNIITWITSYLHNRKQFVAVNNHTSNSLNVLSGVPQGSVLAPILFLIYINDIPMGIDSSVQIRLFADDCVVYTRVNRTEDQINLNHSLTKIRAWCSQWGMTLNARKTVAITFTNKKKPLNFAYTLDNLEITKSDQVKYLGVTLTSNLNWEPHITAICSKAQGKLGFLKRKLRNTPPAVKLTAYKTLIRPALEYADIIWSPYQKFLINKIERVQNLAVRFVFSDYSRYTSVTNLRKRAELHSLSDRRIHSKLKFLYLLYHGNYTISRSDHLLEPFRHSTRTNHNKTIRLPTSHNNIHKNSVFPSSIAYWNQLPSSAVNCVTVESFIERIKTISFVQ